MSPRPHPDGSDAALPHPAHPRPTPHARLRALWRSWVSTLRLIAGMPDYDNYVAHCHAHHPETPPMSFEAFVRDRIDARYGGKGKISRCC